MGEVGEDREDVVVNYDKIMEIATKMIIKLPVFL